MRRESLLRAVWHQNRSFPVLILGLLLVNVAIYVALYAMVWPRLNTLEREFITLQARVRSDRAGAGRTPQEAFAQAETDLAKFRAFLPERAEFPALVRDLFAQAGQSGLEIGPISYDPKELDDHQLLMYTVQFSVTGTYAGIKTFIQSLEESSRLIVLDSLALDSVAQGERVGKVTLRLRLVTYFQGGQS